MGTLRTRVLVMASYLGEIARRTDWSAFSLDDDRGEDGGMSTVIIIGGLVAAAGVIIAAISGMASEFASFIESLGPGG